ncbi:hypothetical protein C4K39_6233 [Pseudomonas sessilinigenes]|nr:hypothetical protein C4K39_6233 [Pseudomonas sessilinigenes]
MLMSPFRTLIKPGSSSKLLDLKKRPNLVKRSESGSWTPLASTPSSIVLNFSISKGLP